ncbi:Hypp1427 [Branchiostoma lanceolatum]|uniref:Hypp1427 protein n=1 Tax=Branchiostoma lanceolatum TaxID=7740 RepID=A0A8K0EKU2_BRALA|nr:Hypp1427 [Branchiostoma lanceolatum]
MRSDGEGTRLALGGQERSLQARLMASEAAMEELRLLRQRQETLVEEAKRKLPQELIRPGGYINSSIDKLRNAVDHLKRTDSDLVGALHTLNTQILQLKLAEAEDTDGENGLMSASCRSMSSSAVSIPSFTSSSRTSTLIDLPDSRRSSGFFDASSPSPPPTPDIASPEKLHHYEEVDGRVTAGWPHETSRELGSVTNSQFYNRHSFGEPESDSVVSNDAKQSYFSSGMMPVQSQSTREEQKKDDSLSRRFKLAFRPRSKSGLSVCYPYPSPMHAIAIQSDMFVPADSESVVEEEHSSVDVRSDHNQSTNPPAVGSDAQVVSLTGVPADDKFVKAPPSGKSVGLHRPISTPPDISRVWGGQVPWTKNSEQTTVEPVDIPDYENIFSAYSELPGNDIAPCPRRHSFAGSHVTKKHVDDAIPTYENLSDIDNEYGDYVTLTPEDLPQISQAAGTRPASDVHSESPPDSGVKPVPAASETVSRSEVHQERKAPRKPKPTPRQSLLKKASPTVTPPSPQPRAEPQSDSCDVNVKQTPVGETSSNKTTSQENTASKTAQPGPALLIASLIADGKVQGLTDVRPVPSKEKGKSPLTKIVGKYSPRKQTQTEPKSSSTTSIEKRTLQEKTKSEHNNPHRKEQPQPDSNSAKTVRMKFRAPPGVDIRPRHCNDKVENSHVRSAKAPSEPNSNRTESRERTTAASSVNSKPRQLKSEGRNSPCRKLQFQHDSNRISTQPREGQVPYGAEISANRGSAQASTRRMSKDAPLPQTAAPPLYVSRTDLKCPAPMSRTDLKCPAPMECHLGQQPIVSRGVATDLRKSFPNSRPEQGGVPHGHRYRPHGDLRQQLASHNPGYAKKDDSSRRYKRHDSHKDSRKSQSDKRARRHTTAVNSPALIPPMSGLVDHRSRQSHSSTSLNGHPVSKFPSNAPHKHRVPHAFSRGVRGLKKAGQSRSTSRLYDYDTSVLGSSSDESSSSDSEIRRSDSESDTESSDEGGLVLAEAKWPAVVGTATRRRLSSQDSLSRMFPSCHLVTEL